MELIIEDVYVEMATKIYVKEKRGSKTIIIGYDGKNLVEQIIPEGEAKEIKPLLTIPFGMKENLIKAFIDLGAKNHLRTENENLLKGKLEATERHLEDMRKAFDNLLEITPIYKIDMKPDIIKK